MSALPFSSAHARAYEIRLIDAPAEGRTDVTFGRSSGRGTVHTLLVSPDAGAAWTAGLRVDDHGERGVDGLFGTPGPTWACVVVRGSAFLFDVLDPATSRPISTDGPVREVVELADEGLLLLATAWSIVAVGAGAMVWTTARLSIESLRLDAIVDHRLRGVADPDDGARPFVVDLRTGAVDGGCA